MPVHLEPGLFGAAVTENQSEGSCPYPQTSSRRLDTFGGGRLSKRGNRPACNGAAGPGVSGCVLSRGPRLKKVLVATSAGGHWVQMRRLLPAFAGCTLCYAGVADRLDPDLEPASYTRLRNASRSDPFGFLVVAWQLATLVRREKPDVVITTGAAPGLVALVLGKTLARSRTVWIDSIANTERLSLSGRLARPVADAWLVQWPHLARPGGPEHWGAVL